MSDHQLIPTVEISSLDVTSQLGGNTEDDMMEAGLFEEDLACP